ncbi:NAD(P)-binding protein [Polychaeton citri CBS 116435]|uniref:NAD(P)-binding protein n=1 Tax=Polychaeton citri CBS 116435 TaxID=1314669 RepID=A0A9P4UUG6_9PEZI|nr:NAD(P)-binding protein [Polychaeton citri CBS 116435]
MPPKTVLVTGANRSIGFCVAQLLGRNPSVSHVIVGARTQAKAEEGVGELKALVPQGKFVPLELDVASDESIKAAVAAVEKGIGSLDVLINNAGIAASPSEDLSDYRAIYSPVFDTNVTAVGLVTSHFLPLLRKGSRGTHSGRDEPRVINVSSGRASLNKLTTGDMAATVSVPYSVSKVALNVLTLEMAKAHPDVVFQLVNPGHCRTAFNGFKGARDPLEGAEVAVDLALAEDGQFEGAGFWEKVDGTVRKMAW